MHVRYDVNSTAQIQASVLYQMPLQSHGIDGFCKLDVTHDIIKSSSILVLLQMSVKQSGHNQKVQSVTLVPSLLYHMIEEVKPVVYLYINPKCTSKITDLSHFFFPAVPKKLKTIPWYFSLPENVAKFISS